MNPFSFSTIRYGKIYSHCQEIKYRILLNLIIETAVYLHPEACSAGIGVQIDNFEPCPVVVRCYTEKADLLAGVSGRGYPVERKREVCSGSSV